jgi:four helix bundle protein
MWPPARLRPVGDYAPEGRAYALERNPCIYNPFLRTAMQICECSRSWPPEEKYSLTDQIRRSSRSVCANLREAWAKRRYEAHFLSKLTDSDAENSETDTWLDFARDCGYISKEEHSGFVKDCQEIGAMLGSMMNKAHTFSMKQS